MSFPYPWKLKRHLERKTPCTPIVEEEDLPEEKKECPNKCRFCGRSFATRASALRHIRNTCKIAPREGNEDGMEKLYEHILKKQTSTLHKEYQEKMAAMQRQIDELRTEKSTPVPATPTALAQTNAIVQNVTQNIAVDNSVNKIVNNTVNVNISVFGQENLGRITKPQVFDILRSLGPVGENVKTVAEKAIIQAAMLIFSDPTHPEDLTCYLPNKKGENALVHGESGWEVQPVGLVISPMAAQSIETLFRHQPAPDKDTPEKDVKWIMDECGNIMRYIQQHEGDLTNEPPRGEMRGVLIRNKELLQQVLKKLPIAGQK
jgi:hypothetical protein